MHLGLQETGTWADGCIPWLWGAPCSPASSACEQQSYICFNAHPVSARSCCRVPHSLLYTLFIHPTECKKNFFIKALTGSSHVNHRDGLSTTSLCEGCVLGQPMGAHKTSRCTFQGLGRWWRASDGRSPPHRGTGCHVLSMASPNTWGGGPQDLLSASLIGTSQVLFILWGSVKVWFPMMLSQCTPPCFQLSPLEQRICTPHIQWASTGCWASVGDQ